MFDRHRLAIDALTAVLAVGGLTLVVIGAGPAPDPSAVDAVRPARSQAGYRAESPDRSPDRSPDPSPSTGDDRSLALGASVPVRLDIPAIGVSTSLIPLGLNADGTVAVPPLRADAPAGWYRNLKTPGEIGPAVLLGHVDTATDGPAVFYRLRELRAGDTAAVRRADGSTAVFTVDRVVEVPKSDFPTDDVYGPVAFPALRLVTCGGTFDRLHRTYRGNIVVYARLTSSS